MTDEDYQKFGRYLFGELMWEFERFGISVPELQCVQKEDIEVLFFYRYDFLRFRVDSTIFCAHLAWRGDVVPSIEIERSA